MINDEMMHIDPALASDIEDAVLLGKAGELEALINSVADDDGFPAELRQSLQSLYYFRQHYGTSELNEIERKKASLMDSAWAMELLNKVRRRIERVVRQA